MTQRFYHILTTMALCAFLAACSTDPEVPEFCTTGKTIAPKKATSRPYQINGIWYYPQPHFEYDETGIASYYGGGDAFHGRPTATGERFDKNEVSAAHKTLPLPCIAIVTNLQNGREIQVRVNDRGPFVEGRIIDVSRRTAQLLGFEDQGTVDVRVRTLVPESLALHGIDPGTVMPAQSAPPSVPATEPVMLASASFVRLPDTLFEEAEEPKPVLAKGEVEAKSTGIFIDVGGYEKKEQAHALQKPINELTNSPAHAVQTQGLTPYAVRVGPFTSMASANQTLDRLVNAGHAMSRIVIHP